MDDEPPLSNRDLIAADSREATLRRLNAVSRELKKSSRALRLARSDAVAKAGRRTLAPKLATRAWNGPRRWVARSFLLAVVLPTILSICYFAFIASNQYESEAQFTVKTGGPSTLDAISSVVGLASLQQTQDAFVVADFIKSRAIVEELDRDLNLREMFSRSSIDFFSRIDPNAPIEKLSRYWWWKVKTTIENPSAVITVTIRAFTPEDSLKIANKVVAISEKLINDMRARAERDLVLQSEREVSFAEARLRNVRGQLTELQNKERIIEPASHVKMVNSLIEQLRLDRIRMAQSLDAMTRTVSMSAPQAQLLNAQIQAIDEQIQKLQDQLTTQSTQNGQGTVSRALLEFEKLDLNRRIAERQYAASVEALERARVTAERKHLYLTMFVQPTLAQESSEPKRVWYSLASFVAFFGLWAIGVGGALSIGRWL